ncbi:aspartate/methionine/tyrosine aminotransferase [Variovorax paradoxus]|uniref:pyridoxal phosphate-dependent aminotransferase n=1 Tax=Variovorax paradoxus TaxID=34073 RepID=UPI00278D05F1|nr:pyridoxal phosphate-dependent aminotransferase [Variovorax paradoxus]MDQ0569898.1 aspartate/methionine/tyrosine aminotransferase [Variovorax paradoxus]
MSAQQPPMKQQHMARFPNNEIISLVGKAPRFDLAESVGPSVRLAELIDTAFGDGADFALDYGTAAGNPELRREIAADNGVDADDVVVTVGGMHALFLIAFMLCQAGDEAIVAEPVFPLARNALTAVGATTRALPLRFDTGYRVDLGALRKLLSPKTKVVSLASPQNPSGVAIPAQTLREIVAMLAEHAPEAWLVIDETYREAAFGDDTSAPSSASLGPRVISVASLSKSHGSAGLRIGWAITRDTALRQALVTAKFSTVISCSPVDEALALAVLRQRDRIIGERRELLAQNLQVVENWVLRHPAHIEWVRPDAGALCCVRLKHEVFDAAAVERFYATLARYSTRVAPGPWFGDEPLVFRLGFGLPTLTQLAIALECVSVALTEAAPGVA